MSYYSCNEDATVYLAGRYLPNIIYGEILRKQVTYNHN